MKKPYRPARPSRPAAPSKPVRSAPRSASRSASVAEEKPSRKPPRPLATAKPTRPQSKPRVPVAPIKQPIKPPILPPVEAKPVEKEKADKNAHLIYGLHAVRQAWLNPERRCTRLLLTESGHSAFAPIMQEAEKGGLVRRPQPQIVPKEQLDRMLPGAVHQGIVLDAPPLTDVALDDILREAALRPSACIVVLDQVTDPHNVGAILRSCAAFGALALVLPDRNAPPLTGVLAKTASGAVDVVPIVRVNNLARALDQLREEKFWCVGFAESGKETLAALNLGGSKVALVLGAEGEGLRRLTMERCDMMARLPTVPPIGSLNVSNAAAVALYEVFRSLG